MRKRDLDRESFAALGSAIVPATRQTIVLERPIVDFAERREEKPLSVRQALSGKQVMLIGVTGFIGKVWLANTLMDLPKIGRIYLLIRRQKSNPALQRFEKLVAESPVFDPLHGGTAPNSPDSCASAWRWLKAMCASPGLGLEPEVAARLGQQLDLVINSSGLTDFNPDLRDALRDQRRCRGERRGVRAAI